MNHTYVIEHFTEIYRRYYKNIMRLAYAHLYSVSDSEDVTQETFRTLYEHDEEFNSEEHIKYWLLNVAIKRCYKVWNMKSLKRLVFVDNIAEMAEAPEEKYSEVLYAVRELPKKYRTLIHLYYYEGYSIREISKIVHINESTLSTRMKVARELLKNALGEDYEI